MAINTVKEKLEQATAIKEEIRQAVMSKGIAFPATTPFEEYPDKIDEIRGILQSGKVLTPIAEGATVTPDEGYDGFENVVLPAEPNLIPANIPLGLSIFGVEGTNVVPPFDVTAFLEGTLVNISGAYTKLRAYCFYNYTTLKTAIFNNLVNLGIYAFAGCSNLESFEADALTTLPNYAFQNCSKLVSLDLSNITALGDYSLSGCTKLPITRLTIPTLGNYACQSLASGNTEGFEYAPSSPAVVGSSCFTSSKLVSLTGEYSKINSNGVYNCSALRTIAVKIIGTVGSYGFANNNYVTDIDIDADSDISSLGTYAFYYLGWQRTTPEANRLTIDLRNSSFPTVDQYAFGYIKYTDVYLPESVTTINSYACRYSQNFNMYFSGAVPPTITNTNWLNNTSNYKLFVPYNYVNAYKTKTNWTTQLSNIVGYAPAGEFEAGATLPAFNLEGRTLTWYSDAAKTTVITVVPEGSPEVYCDCGERAVWIVSVVTDEHTALSVVDNTGVEYTSFPAFVPNGRSLTLDVEEQTGWSNSTTVDGVTVTLPHTTAVLSSDITIKSKSWEGDIDPDFDTCTWANIKKAVDAGVAASLWPVGSTRTITTKDNQTITLRIANNDDSMYEYANKAGTTGFVMEFVELWKDTHKMNTQNTNIGGWNGSEMRTVTMPLIWAQLPDELKAVIATVKIKACSSGTDGTLLTSNDTLFLPAEREIFASRSYSRPEEWDALRRWAWYAQHDTNNDRIKRRNGSATYWWERSPCGGGADYFCVVSNGGYAGGNFAGGSGGVAPGFCI